MKIEYESKPYGIVAIYRSGKMSFEGGGKNKLEAENAMWTQYNQYYKFGE